MDYSVGSLADLISGSNTPNKPKVIKTEFRKNSETFTTEHTKKNVKKERFTVEEFKNQIKKVKSANASIKKEINKLTNSKQIKEESNNFESFTETGKGEKRRKRKFERVSTDAVDEGVSLPKIHKTNKNAQRRIKKKIKGEKKVRDAEDLARTIFVGNIPITCKKKKLKGHFKKYGEIETIRIRGIPVADMNTSKKVAAIKKEFNPNRSNVFCYIR